MARADAGLAFDGDADRVIAVDERGVLVDGDEILAISAIDLHDRKLLRGDAVVATVMSNLGLRRALEPYGIAVVETPVGRPQRARRAGAAQPHPRRRAVGARDLRRPRHHRRRHPHRHRAARHDGPARAVALRAGRRCSPGCPRCSATSRSAVPTSSGATPPSGAACRDVDDELGDDGRVLVRPSGTEPLVRVMVEATDADAAAEAADRLVELVEHAASRAPHPLGSSGAAPRTSNLSCHVRHRRGRPPPRDAPGAGRRRRCCAGSTTPSPRLERRCRRTVTSPTRSRERGGARSRPSTASCGACPASGPCSATRSRPS